MVDPGQSSTTSLGQDVPGSAGQSIYHLARQGPPLALPSQGVGAEPTLRGLGASESAVASQDRMMVPDSEEWQAPVHWPMEQSQGKKPRAHSLQDPRVGL